MAKITLQHIADYVVTELSSGLKPKEVASKVAAYLLDSRQSRDAIKLMREIERTLQKNGNAQVTITSSHELTSEINLALAELLGVKNPIINSIIDPNVIGGAKARSGEVEIDLTVRGRLNKFKNKVVNA